MSISNDFLKSHQLEINRKQEWPSFKAAVVRKYDEVGPWPAHFFYSVDQTLDEGKNRIRVECGDVPVNTRRISGQLKVDFEGGSLISYTQQLNGGILCEVKGFDGITYLKKNYESASEISGLKFKIHFCAYLAVVHCTSQRQIPTWKYRLMFSMLKFEKKLKLKVLIKIISAVFSIATKVYGTSMKP